MPKFNVNLRSADLPGNEENLQEVKKCLHSTS